MGSAIYIINHQPFYRLGTTLVICRDVKDLFSNYEALKLPYLDRFLAYFLHPPAGALDGFRYI